MHTPCSSSSQYLYRLRVVIVVVYVRWLSVPDDVSFSFALQVVPGLSMSVVGQIKGTSTDVTASRAGGTPHARAVSHTPTRLHRHTSLIRACIHRLIISCWNDGARACDPVCVQVRCQVSW